MRVRRVREQAIEHRDGTPARSVRVLEEADAPDDALNLDIDARMLPNGKHSGPIITIDYEEGWYERLGSGRLPIPDKVWHAEDLNWRTVRVLP